MSKITPGHNAFPAEGIAKGNRYMIKAFHYLLKCEACGKASNPSQGHQQADKYSIPIPTLPCKAKNKSLIANRQSSCPQLSGYEVSLVPDGSCDCQEMLLLNLLKTGIVAKCSILLGFRFHFKIFGKVEIFC